jgi:hypothetical protein
MASPTAAREEDPEEMDEVQTAPSGGGGDSDTPMEADVCIALAFDEETIC